MKVLLIVVIVAAVALAHPQNKYTNRYDNIDVEQVLANNRLLNKYVQCLADEGKCTPDAAELKRILPDALETDCSKCSEKQKNVSKKVIKFLINQKPEIWQKLETKYDPNGKYKTKYSDLAKSEGININ